MALIVSHAAVGVAIGLAFAPGRAGRRYLALGAACAMLPDLDTVGVLFGRPASPLLAHRGLSHSLAFAVVAGAVISLFLSRIRRWPITWRHLFCYATVATMSHGLVDSTTTYGRGVALFAPFSSERVVSPYRPLGAVDFGAYASRSGKIMAGVQNELMWLWVPAAVLVLTVRAVRQFYPSGKGLRDERSSGNAAR